LWAFYKNGATVEVLIKRYPRLGPGKILDALAFAFDNREVIEQDIEHEQQLLAQSADPAPPPQLDLPFDEEPMFHPVANRRGALRRN
jgi:hypothetical protein